MIGNDSKGKLPSNSRMVKEATGALFDNVFEEECYELGGKCFREVCNTISKGEAQYADMEEGLDMFFMGAKARVTILGGEPEEIDVRKNYLSKIEDRLRDEF